MTTPNTTARQAGLTDEQIDAIFRKYREHGMTHTGGINVQRDLVNEVIAAHSADARNAAMDKEVCDAFNSGFAAGEAAGIRKARNGEGVALTDVKSAWEIAKEGMPDGMCGAEQAMRFAALLLGAQSPRFERLRRFLDTAAGEGYEFCGVDAGDLYIEFFGEDGELLAAPAAPAPTGKCEHCGMTGGHSRECPNVDPAALTYNPWGTAPAAQADDDTASIAYQAGYEAGMRRATRQQSDAKLDTAFSGAVNAAVALERKQFATPVEPVRIEARVTANTPWMHILACEVANCQAMGWEVRKLYATPADAASEANKRDAERYQLIKRSGLILSGGYTKFGWLISPFGDQCDKYLDAVLQRERQQGAEDA